ncbi:hypothetical protein PtA15_17A116 [Puccinia triticina]|uniref:No apical meristem-associated C-terminal domain-containing protein n=1 Tax=Puccinia triticina TaxID=208348 RepID=A0ABY7D798_9BASI|nr:uncharacterized protein PtA15_17A116 [Puccinia triticina]WAQ92634.1 hypothetical protein PtA15_17A116 [Puccinia triticina]
MNPTNSPPHQTSLADYQYQQACGYVPTAPKQPSATYLAWALSPGNYLAGHPQPQGNQQGQSYSQISAHQHSQGNYLPTNLGALNQHIPRLATPLPASLPNPLALLPLATPVSPTATASGSLATRAKKAGRAPTRKGKLTPQQMAHNEDAAALTPVNRVKKAANKATTAQEKVVAKQTKALHCLDKSSTIVPCLV